MSTRMKKFAGIKPSAAIRAQCKAQGLLLDDKAYRTQGMDTIVVFGGGARAYYNTFNGNFFGVTPTGVEFSSSSTKHEHEPWFQALLSFFYTEKRP